ncbi:CPBP family intramembrane metalloprotease [Halobacillus locisalis]|uniref:CPBP family intramembrane metalloprotease n=1 Tax=Halobacillus locisalis TaxID=220753 RepID=A0A838CVY7_9BACI|nr:type II CAAX endopeptidase family protein [Halobacillus locisalis]MBA2176312.1 CPBP family intramembrane metalloprotease [Halobacillus locisalis]
MLKKEKVLFWIQILLFFIAYLVIEAYLLATVMDATSEWFVYKDFMSILMFTGLTIVVLTLPALRRHFIEIVGVKALIERSTYLWLFILLLVLYLSRELIFSMEFLFDESFLISYTYGSYSEPIFYLIGVIIFAPVYEEFLFRGLLLHGFRQKMGPGLSILITSLLFGFIHDGYVVFGIVMGLSFGLMFHIKRSLAAAILLHILWNALASL